MIEPCTTMPQTHRPRTTISFPKSDGDFRGWGPRIPV